jgi:hypothetical protein
LSNIDTTITISTEGSNFDTAVVVFSGDCSTLSCVVSNDDFDISLGVYSVVDFCSVIGSQYFVFVGGFADDNVGDFALSITSGSTSCANPGLACDTSFPITLFVDNTVSLSGTTSTLNGNFILDCLTAAFDGFWYSFTNGFDSQVTIDTFGSNFDTALVAVTGSCSTPACVASNDDTAGLQSQITFCAPSGVPFFVFVGGFVDDVVGDFVLTFTTVSTTCTIPGANCDASIDLVLTQDSTSVTSGTTSAALANSVSDCSGFPTANNGYWYHFNNAFNSDVTIDTFGSSFDTVLQVMSGLCASRACVTANDDSAGLQSQVNFCAAPNSDFFVFVGGFGGSTGSFVMTITTVTSLCGIPGLSCDASIGVALSANSVNTVNGATSITFANSFPFACSGPSNGNGVWYSFNLAFSSNMQIDTIGSDFDTVLFVVSGSCASPVCVASDDDTGPGLLSQVNFCASPAVDYFVFVAGFGGNVGNYALTFTTGPSCIPGETCGTANSFNLVLNDFLTFSGTTATSLANSETNCAFPAFDGVWFTYLSNIDTTVTISTEGSNFDTAVVVFSGDCSTLSCVVSNDDFDVSLGVYSVVDFCSAVGSQYFVFVGGFADDNVGDFVLSITSGSSSCANPGLACDTSFPITLFVDNTFSLTGTTSTINGNFILDCLTPAFDGFWYSFTNGFDSQVTIDTFGSNFDTALVAVTGSCSTPACVASNDDTAGLQSQITFCAPSGVPFLCLLVDLLMMWLATLC